MKEWYSDLEKQAKEHIATLVKKYRIAGLNVLAYGENTLFDERAKPYSDEFEASADIEIDLSKDYYSEMHKTYPNLTRDECGYIVAGNIFHYNLIFFGRFMLHSSAVVLDGKAYLFSAPSGTGKSTHTSLWCKTFGPDRARILNDDKPVIKQIEDQYIAYGTPWSGSSPLNFNGNAPIQGIAFLEQSLSDWIFPLDHAGAIKSLLSQTYLTRELEHTDKLLFMLDGLIRCTSIYRMGCTISQSAVEMAYALMGKHKDAGSCIHKASAY